MEQQETPGRKAQAFQKLQRWWKQREHSRKHAPQLPPALLQEMWREVLKGPSPDGALLTDIDVARLTGRALAELSEALEPRANQVLCAHAPRTGVARVGVALSEGVGLGDGGEAASAVGRLYSGHARIQADIPCPDEHNQDRLIALMVSPRQRIRTAAGFLIA